MLPSATSQLLLLQLTVHLQVVAVVVVPVLVVIVVAIVVAVVVVAATVVVVVVVVSHGACSFYRLRTCRSPLS